MKIIFHKTIMKIALLNILLFSFHFILIAEESDTVFSFGELESINRNISTTKEPPIGKNGMDWGVVASFKLKGNAPRARFLETLPDGDIILMWEVSGYGYIGRFSHEDYNKIIWKKRLPSEYVFTLKTDPKGKTFAIDYKLTRSKQFHLEIRNAEDGNIIHKIYYGKKENINVEEGMDPWEMTYSPDGKMIAVRFKPSYSDNIKNWSEHIATINVKTGKAVSRAFYLDQVKKWRKQGMSQWLPITFSKNGKYVYIAGNFGIVLKYKTEGLKLVEIGDYFDEMINIIEGTFGEELVRFSLTLTGLYSEPDGGLLAVYGGQGEGTIFRVSKDMKNFSYVATSEGARNAIDYSPDRSMFMVNLSRINLWDMKTKRFKMYYHGRFTEDLTKFHPVKRALIYADDKYIFIISKLNKSQKHIGSDFTDTGHYLNAYNDFCVRGPGEILWAYDDYEIYKSYAKENELTTGVAFYNNDLYNNEDVIKESSQLRLKTTEPGIFTIWGGSSSSMTDAEILLNLPEW